jgi:hypothetical protein
VPSTAVSQFLLRWLLVPIVLLWVYHLLQRRHTYEAGPKRMATLLLTGLLLVLWVASYAFVRYSLADSWLVLVVGALAAVAVWQRKAVFPYRLTCARCGRTLSAQRILFQGSNECDTCDPLQAKEDRP